MHKILFDTVTLLQIQDGVGILPKLPKEVWNSVIKPLPTVSQTCANGPCAIPEGAVAILMPVMLGVLVGTRRGLRFVLDYWKPSDPAADLDFDDTPEPSAESEDETDDPVAQAVAEAEDAAVDSVDEPASAAPPASSEAPDEEVLDDIAELQQKTIAPAGIKRNFYDTRCGQQYRRVLFAEEWPDILSERPLEHIFSTPSLQFDMAVHFEPKDRQRAIRDAEKRAEDLRADASVQGNSAGAGARYAAGDKQKQANAMERMRESMKEGSQPFDVSLYVSVRADSKDELKKQEERLVTKMKDDPGDITLSTVRGKQVKGLQSISPIGNDVLRKESEVNTSSVVLGGGCGALLGSMNVSTQMDPDGIEIGEHVSTGAPLIRDPFESETNYNQVIIGDSGTGKSFDVKLQAFREASRSQDKMIVMLDPLGGFHGLSHALDAEHVVVGGSRGLNPLEIQKPSEEAVQRIGETFNPFKQALDSAMGFLENYFVTQGLVEDGLGEYGVVLNDALVEAYERNGITEDIETHDNPSPTIRDLREVLSDMQDDPGEFGWHEDQHDYFGGLAGKLHSFLRPFVRGQYANLGRQSELNIRGNDFVYIDLEQQESSGGGGSGLMMQLLFQIVYERAKSADREVVFIIDEAQFLLKEAATLEYLAQRIRHSRHFDMSIRLATQNVKDFMRTDEATDIINNCYQVIFHRTNEVHEFKDELKLSDAHANFIDDLRTGKDYDHSQALFRINQDEFPVKIEALPAEQEVVDFDPNEDNREDLPGIREQVQESPLVHNIRAQLREYAEDALEDSTPMDPAIPGDMLDESWRTLDDEKQEALDLVGWDGLTEAIERVNEGEDPNAVIAELIDRKIEQTIELAGESQIEELLDSRRGSDQTQPEVEADGGEEIEDEDQTGGD